MAEPELLVEIKDRIATLTINRPEAMNAFTRVVTLGLADNLTELQKPERDDVRVIVIRGAGDKAFCAGHDLKERAYITTDAEFQAEQRRISVIMDRLYNGPRPSIAAVRGYCMGGGCWLAASCDIVVAAEDAVFALAQLKATALFPLAPMVPIIRSIGRRKFLEMVITGRRYNAHQAEAMGLANMVVPPDELGETVNGLISDILSMSARSIAFGKEAMSLGYELDFERAQKAMLYALALLHTTEDVQEAKAIRREGRAPVGRWK